MLSCVASTARSKDVLDAIGATPRQRNPMVGLDGARLTAVSAAALVKRHQSEPVRRRERALGREFAGAIVLPAGETNFRVLAMVESGMRQSLVMVPRVVEAVLRAVLVRVSDPPATNGCPRLFGIALEPFARVPTLLIRILVCHALYLPDEQRRVNRTAMHKKARALGPGLAVAGARFERATFGL
jgi:hypothetical protein